MATALGLLLLAGGCGLDRQMSGMHLRKGESALERNDLDAALVEFKEAIELNPELAEGHTGLGLVYKRKGDLHKAAEALEDAVRIDPFRFLSMFELGEVYRLLDRLSQAIRAYALACKLDPNNFDSRFRLASCYHQKGELDEAIQTYEAAIAIDERNGFAWSNLGAVHDAQGATYEAIRAYKRSLECDTNQPLVLVNLATVYLNQERYAIARRTLETALQMSPQLSVAHERMGYCFWREGEHNESALAYWRSIAFDPKNAGARAGYGVVRMTQYLSDPSRVSFRDEAVESWHRSLELNPNQPKLRALLDKYRVKTAKPVLSLDR